MDSYRVIIAHSTERNAFVARAPELPECEATGATRAEALEALEQEIDAQVEQMREKGTTPPVPLDQVDMSGELNVTVSTGLHRELEFLARSEQVDLDALLPEILTRAVSGRRPGPRATRVQSQPRGQGRGRRGTGGGGDPRYHDIMENRADFIDYVRRLEGPGGSGRSGGQPRGGRGRGRGRGGNDGGDDRGNR